MQSQKQIYDSVWKAITLASAVLVAGVFGLPALAQQPSSLRSVGNPNPINTNFQGTLIRQDFSDCANSNVTIKDPTLIVGVAFVSRGTDGNVNVRVEMTAKANTKYNFYLKCVRQLGTVMTSDEGIGISDFQFPASSVGASFAFDMYPDGAPAGDKFQSIPVKLP
jgi:hypothetical protein